MEFQLNPDLDIASAARQFAEVGFGTLDEFLAPGLAEALLAHLQSRPDWKQVFNSGEKVIELDRATRSAMSETKLAQLEGAIFSAARYDFQYRYESVRVPDSLPKQAQSDDILQRFGRFLRSEPVLNVFREVCGDSSIVFTDAQATAYGPGDFLTEHDDNVAGKHRLAAFTFGLNQAWRPEWGGLLLFHSSIGKLQRAIAPGFNLLSIFKVPQPHSVTMVTPFAPRRRYSITGWARTVVPA